MSKLVDMLPALLTNRPLPNQPGNAPGAGLHGAVPPVGGTVSPATLPLLPPGRPLPPGVQSPAAAMQPSPFPPSTPIVAGASDFGGGGGGGIQAAAPQPPADMGAGSSAGGAGVGQTGMPTTNVDGSTPGAGQVGPHLQYETVTQSDGSILLHIKNPDGSVGPAVKIIKPPKRAINDEAAKAAIP